MKPFLPSNSVVTIKKVPPGSSSIGDMVLFELDQGILVLHRVVRKRRNPDGRYWLQTKGDAVSSFDVPVSSDRVLGKVCQVKRATASGKGQHIHLNTKPWKIIFTLVAMVSLTQGLIWKAVANFEFHLLRRVD